MLKRLTWPIFFVALIFVGLVYLAQPISRSAQAEQDLIMVRVKWENHDELRRLTEMFDVWDILLDEQIALIAADGATVTLMEEAGWSVTADPVLTAFHLQTPIAQLGERSADSFFGGYKNNAEILAELQNLNAQYPNLTELFDYGDSLCKIEGGCLTPNGDVLPGHDLFALRITNEAISGTSHISGTTVISGSKPVFMLHSGIHARELAVPETALSFARWLLENHEKDSEANLIVDWQESWIIPIANPDGYDVVFLGTQSPYNGVPFLHRKNGRSAHMGDCVWPSNSGNHFGVDLNRNHSFGWGPIGTSLNPCQQNYRGASGGSEPETAAFEQLLASLIADQRGPNRTDVAPADTTGLLITMHSFGEVVIWPWGDGIFPNNFAPNHEGLKAIGDRLALASGYTSLQGNDYGGVSGATEDHVYGTLGVPAFTVEIGTTFLQSFDYTTGQIWAENRPMLLYAATLARTPYQTVFGPEISNLEYVVIAETLIISGTVSDVQNGNNLIEKVLAQLEIPFPLEADASYAAAATDGAFDSPVEQFVIGPIPFPDLEESDDLCRPIDVYLHGVDQAGYHGPTNGIIVRPEECQLNQYYFPLFFKN